MLRVLIVGAGLTGSLCACLLRRALQNRVHIEVWDKSRGTGGRMSTSRFRDDCFNADIGAQYITATQDYRRRHHSLYEELLSAGVLVPMSCSVLGLRHKEPTEDFVSPQGTGQIVKHFLHSSEAELHLKRHVTSVQRTGASWEVEFSEGQRESFDAVVLTIPVPQILQLKNFSQLLSPEQLGALSQVQYSSRFALALFFDRDSDLNLDFGFKYVTDSKLIRYVSVEQKKRGSGAGLGPVLVVHSSVDFGSEFLESDLAQVQSLMMDELRRLHPDLPEPINIKTHKWRYSQVLTSLPGCPGHMTAADDPLLLLGGDAFTHSNFDGCAESALSMLRTLTQSLHWECSEH